MSALALVAGLIVGAAFVVAGASKLAAGRGWNQLRVPAWLAAPVPFVEIVVGALLIVQLWRPWPAVAALALLVAFTALLLAHLRAGSRPPCACFGAWSAKPISWHHLARNLVFLALAILALFPGG